MISRPPLPHFPHQADSTLGLILAVTLALALALFFFALSS